MLEYICEYCGKKFHAYKQNKNRFCSQKHYHAFNDGKSYVERYGSDEKALTVKLAITLSDDESATSVEERINKYSYIESNHDCILWSGHTVKGAPVIYSGIEKRQINICRYLLRKKLGRDIDRDKLACHKCDNVHGPCINIEHLWEGTYYQNTQDMIRKGRDNFGRKKGLINASRG